MVLFLPVSSHLVAEVVFQRLKMLSSLWMDPPPDDYEFPQLSSSVFKLVTVVLMFTLFISGYVVHLKISSYLSMMLACDLNFVQL